MVAVEPGQRADGDRRILDEAAPGVRAVVVDEAQIAVAVARVPVAPPREVHPPRQTSPCLASGARCADREGLADARFGPTRPGRPSCAPCLMYRHKVSTPAHIFVDFSPRPGNRIQPLARICGGESRWLSYPSIPPERPAHAPAWTGRVQPGRFSRRGQLVPSEVDRDNRGSIIVVTAIQVDASLSIAAAASMAGTVVPFARPAVRFTLSRTWVVTGVRLARARITPRIVGRNAILAVQTRMDRLRFTRERPQASQCRRR